MIVAGDPAYEDARRTANARVDAFPEAIARCRSRADVVTALEVAADRGLPLAIRAGGTSDGATVDGGIVIDLSPMKGIEVDPEARTASVEPGVTWAELDEATQDHGLAVTGARVSRLGVAGVALGDGSGWLERSLGTTGANLIGTEVVEGVVTRLDLQLHAVGPTLLCGFLGFPRDRAGEVARAYRDFMRTAPDALGGGLLLGAGLGGVCTIVVCHHGAVEDGEHCIAPLRELGPPLDAVAPNPYRAFQRMWDDSNPAGTRVHVRGASLRELPDACLDATIARANLPAASLSYVFLRPLGGALTDPDATWACECVGLWPPVPALDPGQIAWVDGLAEAIAPHARSR